MVIEHFLSWMQTAPVPKRAQAVNALARAYLHSDMSYEDRITAESAMTLMLEDPSSTVRFALADALASSKNAPKHIILGLAEDTTEIATIILSRSPLLMTGELVDMVASGTVEQQIAIACRSQINSALCGAISEVGVVEACMGLLMNKAAKRSKRILMRIVERHGNNVEIRRLLLKDKELYPEVRVRLLEKLGDNLQQFVTGKSWISKVRAQKSIRDTLDSTSIVYAAKCNDQQVSELVETLIESRRLTTGFLLRSICMGNITLFCKAMSRLSDIPCPRIEAMISQKGHSAFRAAFVKSGMPEDAFEVFSTALDVWQELLSEPEWISRARMPYLVTRQLVGKLQSESNQVVDELLMLLRKISSDLARDEAKSHVMSLSRQRELELADDCKVKLLESANNATFDVNEAVEDIEIIDEQFIREIEDSIAQSLASEIIEVTENDIQLPVQAANDLPDVNVGQVINNPRITAAEEMADISNAA